METKSYFFNVDKSFLKQGYVVTDEEKKVVYEVKMTKFTLFTPFGFQFINHVAGTTVDHKIGHTVTLESSNGGIGDMFSTKSWFKFDGKNIWDYLHAEGVRIDSNISGRKLGMDYTVSLKGKEIARLSSSNPVSGFILTAKVCYDIKTTEEYLDLAVLCAVAFARTEQALYD